MHLRKILPWNPHLSFFESPNFLPVFRETFPFFQLPNSFVVGLVYTVQVYPPNPTTKLSPKLCSQHRMICLIILLHLRGATVGSQFSRCDSGRVEQGIWLMDFHLKSSNTPCIEWGTNSDWWEALRRVSGINLPCSTRILTKSNQWLRNWLWPSWDAEIKHMKTVNFRKGQVTSGDQRVTLSSLTATFRMLKCPYLSPSVESYSSRAGNLRDTSQAPKIGTSRSTPMADLARESLDQHPARTTSNIPHFVGKSVFLVLVHMYNTVLYAS